MILVRLFVTALATAILTSAWWAWGAYGNPIDELNEHGCSRSQAILGALIFTSIIYIVPFAKMVADKWNDQ